MSPKIEKLKAERSRNIERISDLRNMNMRTKRMFRRGLTALAIALAMMTVLRSSFAYAGDSANNKAED